MYTPRHFPMKIPKPHLTLSTLALFSTLSSSFAASADFKTTEFADSSLTPSPSCLSAHANGDVFVGVDLLGSLGKGPNKGRIVKLIDSNNDGKADKHSIFAKVDNPRGLIAMGDKLYVLHTVIPESTGKFEGMHLSVFTDANNDGVADGPAKRLIENVSTAKHNQERGADHTTNGIRMGIDGWIYIAVGDFGFVDAKGADGTTFTKLGGGILRVRPDGSEMEMYTHGLRNIYDVAIDPFMNIFTRGNTNDGGGWNVRFIDQIQTGNYGYPTLYKHFTNEIIPALQDLGGGSGTGALFLNEPTWPKSYNNQPLMSDWGRNQVYLHRLTADGPSFTQKQENFLGISQPSDIDVDGSGRLFVAAWAGAGYKGNDTRGFIQQVTPKGWKYKAFPDLTKLSEDQLIKALSSSSATARLSAQQELLSRDSSKVPAESILKLAADSSQSLETRVAAIFTYAQLAGSKATPALTKLTADKDIREFALRALSDRRKIAKTLPLEPFTKGLEDSNPRTRAAAIVGLGRIGNPAAAEKLITQTKYEGDSSTDQWATALYKSEVIKGSDTVKIDADIERVKKLYFIVDDAGDGNTGDHAAWADAYLVKADGTKKALSKFKWSKAQQGAEKTLANKSCSGSALQRVDGKSVSHGIGTHSLSVIEYTIPMEYVRFQATGTLTPNAAQNKGSVRFVLSPIPPTGDGQAVGPHATPNSNIVLPHLAVQSLVSLNATEASLAAIDSSNQDGALWALRLMHDPKAVAKLIDRLDSADTSSELREKLWTTLARLYKKEAPYDGSWWWKTRPDTRGPYYVPVKWEESAKIEAAFRAEFDKANAEGKKAMAAIATKHRMNLKGIGAVEREASKKVKTVGDTSIEDVMLSFEKLKGNKKKGKALMKKQACAACHSLENSDPKKGPDLNAIGSILDREAIAEAILKPDATIAENWVDVTMNDKMIHQGTLVSKDAKTVVVRNIGGVETKLDANKVKSINKSTSTIMGPHLLDSLTLKQFADVVEYLATKK